MNDWLPVATAVFFGGCTVVLLVFFLRAVMKLQKAIARLERRLDGLDKKIAAQSAEIAKLQDGLTEQKADPLMSVVETAFGWKDRGPALTAGLVGAQLFRSYWRSKRAKALPPPKEKTGR